MDADGFSFKLCQIRYWVSKRNCQELEDKGEENDSSRPWKPCNPVVIWQSKFHCCFRKLLVLTWAAGFHYYCQCKIINDNRHNLKCPQPTSEATKTEKESRVCFFWQHTISNRDPSTASEFRQNDIFGQSN